MNAPTNNLLVFKDGQYSNGYEMDKVRPCDTEAVRFTKLSVESLDLGAAVSMQFRTAASARHD
jgi:hypothetical protein